MRRARVAGALAALFAVLAGCSDHGTEPPPDGDVTDPVSYAGDVQPIWNVNCVGCHGAGGNGGLDLRAPDSRDRLVGIASSTWSGNRVTVGKPDESVLYLKLTGAAGVGDQMPLGGNLDASDLETVRLWIVEGAGDN